MKRSSSPFTRTLQLAAENLGGVPELAIRLGIDRRRLERWMSGDEAPPHEVFTTALDVVAAGPTHASAPPAGAGKSKKA